MLRNGESFYAAELKAIAEARESIHLEAYIFIGDGWRGVCGGWPGRRGRG